MSQEKTGLIFTRLNLGNEIRLILSSFLMLFVELVIIRWAGANLYYLFAFTNIILIASFLGMGTGFLRPLSKNLFYLSPMLLALLIFICYYFNLDPAIRLNPVTDNIDYSNNYFNENFYPVMLTLPIIFCLTVTLMMSLAEGVKQVFQHFPPLQAYRLEIIGSLSGLILFSILSLLQVKPFLWGVIICLCYLVLLKNKFHRKLISFLQIISLLIMMIIFIWESGLANHFWSAYYKIVLQPYSQDRYAVKVNGLVQQIIESVEQRKRVKPFYMIPYQYRLPSTLDNVLVIGAGTGGDVAIALAQGAKHVDAVEIDPMLYALGKKFNPDQPYQDGRVSVTINDGRAFLLQTKKQYDMIIYALTDSLSLIMGQSSLRLENYLYTQEGINEAAKHLTSNGIFTIYNYIQPEWLVSRLANTMQNAFHSPPCIRAYSSKDYFATVLVSSKNKGNISCENYFNNNTASLTSPVSDDHPFIYLKNDKFPDIYLVSLSFLLLGTLVIIKLSGLDFRNIPKHSDLFLMGAAFLLLETKNVINFALLFGTTWFVNALVFIGIIFTVYLAIEVAQFVHSSKKVVLFLYFLLLASLLIAFFIPNDFLLALSPFPRFLIATALAFLPVFIANLIFVDSYRQAQQSTIAFGANLIGAVLGGMLEYSSLIIGYGNLFLIVAGIYTLAICFRLATH